MNLDPLPSSCSGEVGQPSFYITKESTTEQYIALKISPTPSLPKRGNSSLYEREERRDLVSRIYAILD
jgi:hypothetical protein